MRRNRDVPATPCAQPGCGNIVKAPLCHHHGDGSAAVGGTSNDHARAAALAASVAAEAGLVAEVRDIAADDEVEALWCAHDIAHESHYGVALSDSRDAEHKWLADSESIQTELSSELAVSHGAGDCKTLREWSDTVIALRAALFGPDESEEAIAELWDTHRHEVPGCHAFECP